MGNCTFDLDLIHTPSHYALRSSFINPLSLKIYPTGFVSNLINRQLKYLSKHNTCPSHHPEPDRPGGSLTDDDMAGTWPPKLVKLHTFSITREIVQTQRKWYHFRSDTRLIVLGNATYTSDDLYLTAWLLLQHIIQPYKPGMTEMEGSILWTVLSNTLFPRESVFRNCFSSSLMTSITCTYSGKKICSSITN